MKNQIIIHASGKQTRVALIENGELAQVFIDSEENQRTVGDIYLAEVHKVMVGIRAAFIRLNTAKDAFLHFSDVGEHLEDYIVMLNGPNAIPKAARLTAEQRAEAEKEMSGFDKQERAGKILQTGQKLLVQIVKEPIGSKGPRISTDITIAGRYLVLIPLGNYIAVSKRIRSFKERKRLRSIVQSLVPENYGVIVRTVAEEQDDEALREDLRDVLQKWESIITKYKDAQPPALLYRDLDMTDSLIRDLFAKDYDRVLIDDPKMHRSIKNYVSKIAPKMAANIQLYKGSEHIFDAMKISSEIDSIFSPRVKMPSGGYLIFEQTEAMYVVDVNSGRYAAKRDQEENSLKTNLEASREIAKQLRLRDIGGIIVVDFIDLKEEVNRKKVYDELKKEFRKDRAKTNVIPMSDFGLIQITRQRIRPSVVNSVSKVCPMCGGTGDVVSQNTVVSDLEAWLNKFKHTYRYRSLDLYLNPFLRSFLTRGFINQIWRWMFKFGIRIHVVNDETMSMNDFRFTLHGSDVDITSALIADEPIEKVIKETQEYNATSRRNRPNLEVEDSDEDSSAKSGQQANYPNRDRRDRGNPNEFRHFRGNRDHRDQRDQRDNRDHRDQRDNRDNRGDRDNRDQQENRSDRDQRDQRSERNEYDNRDGRGPRDNRENQDQRDHRGQREQREQRDRRDQRGNRGGQQQRSSQDDQPQREPKGILGEPIVAPSAKETGMSKYYKEETPKKAKPQESSSDEQTETRPSRGRRPSSRTPKPKKEVTPTTREGQSETPVSAPAPKPPRSPRGGRGRGKKNDSENPESNTNPES
jgi:ribonuclease G